MLLRATTTVPVSWVAGDPDTKTRRVHEKSHKEPNWTQIYLELRVFNYISTLLQVAACFIAHGGVTYVDVLRCRLRRQQTAQIPLMRRSSTVQWRRRPAQNSAQGWIFRSSNRVKNPSTIRDSYSYKNAICATVISWVAGDPATAK
jgi:hypothetical protein